jgi:hypothetical protein
MSIRAAVIMVLTFVFGIVPATMLAPSIVVLGVAGVAALFVDPAAALIRLVLIAVSVLAVFGYVALFFAAGDAATSKIALWLAGGIVANAIGIGLLAGQMKWSAPGDWVVIVAPLIVGCAHVARYACGRSR